MKQYIVLLFVCFNIFSSNLFADSAYQHFSTEELKQANMLIKGMKSNDDTYKKYLETHKSINEALFLCKHGLSQKLKWNEEKQGFELEGLTMGNSHTIVKLKDIVKNKKD